jgi:amino acid transporter
MQHSTVPASAVQASAVQASAVQASAVQARPRAQRSLKRLLLGQPLATADEQHQRLGKPTALAVFASDAISSTAYASEEILLVLVPAAGLTVALDQLIPISLIVMVLLVLVITSYRQTMYAYPSGGGSYVVSRENLGVMPALVAGGSLLVDYILTVAVSVSAGVAAITSAFPVLLPQRVVLCLAFIIVMTLANLRGLKESGRLFAGPTYVYVISLGLLILVGLVRVYTGHLTGLPPNEEAIAEVSGTTELAGLTLLLFLRAFSSGAVALTGVEAISNGVPAFRPPESRNASITLMIMGTILGVYFFGISVLANQLQPSPTHSETLLSVMGRAVFGGETPPYYVLQFATFAILILAANTAFADFPRVTSILAADGYLPNQLANRGDRLVFSNGVLALAAVASLLIVAFGGNTSRLIPLYAVGVFCGFTLSQVGMVRHHQTLRQPGWRRNAAINAVGAVATFVVLAVVLWSKFTIGAWIPAVLIPAIVFLFLRINRHYRQVRAVLVVEPGVTFSRHAHTVVILVGAVNLGVLRAVAYARSMSPDRLIAISVVYSAEDERRVVDEWERFKLPVELRTVYSPFRDLTGPVLDVIDELDETRPDDVVTVVIPELVVEHWWDSALHNQSALIIKSKLRRRPNTAIVSVPVHVALNGTSRSSLQPDRSGAPQ